MCLGTVGKNGNIFWWLFLCPVIERSMCVYVGGGGDKVFVVSCGRRTITGKGSFDHSIVKTQ